MTPIRFDTELRVHPRRNTTMYRLLSYLRDHEGASTTSRMAARVLRKPVMEVRRCFLRARQVGLVQLTDGEWRWSGGAM